MVSVLIFLREYLRHFRPKNLHSEFYEYLNNRKGAKMSCPIFLRGQSFQTNFSKVLWVIHQSTQV
jgi:hypothetical protein